MLIPVLSRLRLWDYFALAGAFLFLLLESLLRPAIRVFPSALVDYIRFKFIGFFPRVFRGYGDDGEDNIVAGLKHIREMIQLWGYPFEEHIVDSDGYYLAIHRIPHSAHDFNLSSSAISQTPPLSSENNATRTLGAERMFDTPRKKKRTPSNIISMWRSMQGSDEDIPDVSSHLREPIIIPSLSSSNSQTQKPTVLLWHGIMMSSEIWVCSKQNSLALMLADEGYDIWLGNNRGNKYCFKHKNLVPSSEKFWDFSLDEYAMDLANVVQYILEQTQQSSLIYIGFSQGTAQLFAALSMKSQLNRQIRLACCLAPTGRPHDLQYSPVTSLVKSSPHLLFLLFGRKAALPSALFWKRVLSRRMLVRALDTAMGILFKWNNSELTFDEKVAHYTHLYSPTSVKTVVHWFQIIRAGYFQMYDDAPGLFNAQSMTHISPQYPLSNIKTPIALFYGAADTLSDINFLISDLPKPVFVLKVVKYEHLDCIWASSAHKIIFPGVVGVMNLFGRQNPDGTPALVPKKTDPNSGTTISDIERVLAHGVMSGSPDDIINENMPYTKMDREEMLQLVVDSDGIVVRTQSSSSATYLPNSQVQVPLTKLSMRTTSPANIDMVNDHTATRPYI